MGCTHPFNIPPLQGSSKYPIIITALKEQKISTMGAAHRHRLSITSLSPERAKQPNEIIPPLQGFPESNYLQKFFISHS